jgi:hypothetical protein
LRRDLVPLSLKRPRARPNPTAQVARFARQIEQIYL